MSARWVVLKFGGTSVSSRARWETIAQVTRERQEAGLRPLLVCSAVSGISDQLEALLQAVHHGTHEAVLDTIVARHEALAEELGIPLPSEAASDLQDLRRLARGAAMIGEVSPRLHARVLSAGELLSTRIGAAWLRAVGLETAWIDARTCLTSREDERPERARLLSAQVDHEPDDALRARLGSESAPVLITQGFIGRDRSGATVLLGRGGSDTSAALFAARVGAVRCEIWTDVPGMYSANPRLVPGARLLKSLHYDEAQEIASTGAKVLHPRCLPPVRAHGIPLHVRCTDRPDAAGTVISGEMGDARPEVKAISVRRGLTLVSMDTVGMWQQVGFLAEVFGCFARQGLSIDLVSTSEANVTVSLDPAADVLRPEQLEAVVADIRRLAQVQTIEGCAAVSLVGRRIRGILHQLGPALGVFEEQRIHLVSQAASDLNLTFVVDDEQAERLVRELHGLLFEERSQDPSLGPAWREQLQDDETADAFHRAAWWRGRRDELLAVAADGPAYVYDEETLDASVAALRRIASVDRIFYAMKANPNPDVLRRLDASGIGFECVSPGEIAHLLEVVPSLPPDRVLFTPNFAPRAEYAAAFERGVHVTLDNLHPLERWPEVFAGRDVMVRLDPGVGRGHHKHVRTAGKQSKFGVAPGEIERLAALADAHGVRVVGLHAHSGSGVRTPESWRETALFLASCADRFPHARVLDVGGGLGVPEKPGQAALDLEAVDEQLQLFRETCPRFALWLEPGRYLVATAGVLLARVTQLKRKGDVRYVGVETGMNSLIRPALYGAWHEIVNLTRIDARRSEVAHVVGPICETGDTLGYARQLPPTEEGDVLLIATAGAYGRAMSSGYNLRPPAREVYLRRR